MMVNSEEQQEELVLNYTFKNLVFFSTGYQKGDNANKK